MAIAKNLRKYGGANGPWNFLPDNGRVVLTRDLDNRIIEIDIYLEDDVVTHFHKVISRDGSGNITSVSEWTVI